MSALRWLHSVRRSVLAGLLGLLPATTLAQDEPAPLSLRADQLLLKLAPLALLDPDATVQAGLEHRVGPRRSVQAELGYGWPGFSAFGAERGRQREVWRVRAEWRTYNNRYRQRRLGIKRANTFPLGGYWAVEAMYKQLNLRQERDVGRDCTGGNCAYFERINTLSTRYVVAAHAKWGWQLPLDAGELRPRWLVDLYVGAGGRHVWVDRLPTNETIDWGWAGNVFGDRFRPQRRTLPSFTLGAKLAYVLR